MTDNLNDNLYGDTNTPEEHRKDTDGDMLSFCEEITVMKTEIKEESYDFEMAVEDMETVNVKEERIFLPEIYFEEDGSELVKSTEQSLNGNLDIKSCEIREAHHGNNKYRCQLCHCNFEENVYLSGHYERCFLLAEQKTSESNNANETYESEHHLMPIEEVYLKETHKDTSNGNLTKDISMMQSAKPKEYKCMDCNYSTNKISNLKDHIRVHSNDRPFKCTYKNCKCTPEKKESCECNMCGYAARYNGNLIKHILDKHRTEPKKYKCNDCNYDTYSKAFLVTHSRIHSGERPYKCTYKNCKCTPGQDESCECDTCRYTTTTSKCLKKHISNIHSTNTKIHKCNDCNFSTKTKAKLVLHIRTHTGEKPFKCTYKNCKCTPGQEELCECSTCEFASINSYRLKQHILSKHSAESKKYKCNNCNYATHKQTSLVLHSGVHSGDKPFKCMYKNCKCTPGQEKPCGCSMCEFATTSNSNLKRHILIKHSVEVKKELCKN